MSLTQIRGVILGDLCKGTPETAEQNFRGNNALYHRKSSTATRTRLVVLGIGPQFVVDTPPDGLMFQRRKSSLDNAHVSTKYLHPLKTYHCVLLNRLRCLACAMLALLRQCPCARLTSARSYHSPRTCSYSLMYLDRATWVYAVFHRVPAVPACS
jgi:hypothetical protein